MEYLLIAAAAFIGGFLGGMLGTPRDKDTPLPVERFFKKVAQTVKPSPPHKPETDLYAEWLYHRPKEVE